ncbi:hypothetical protein [Clostridium sp. B9]|uniref:hypothetical protein n=1 Tax=Clostridium sp. B9 TaxID=3423224 RepID=UPI003D2EBADA
MTKKKTNEIEKNIDEIVYELNKLYDNILVINDSVKLNNEKSIKDKDYVAVIADLNSYNEDLSFVKKYLAKKIPVVLLNISESNDLSEFIGIDFNGKWAVIRPYENFNVFNIADTDNFTYNEYSKRDLLQDDLGNFQGLPVNNDCSECNKYKEKLQDLGPQENAKAIKKILDSTFKVPVAFQEENKALREQGALPANQFWMNYIPITSEYIIGNQTVKNEIIMEVSLFASFYPNYKYLRIRSVGAGFHPSGSGPISWYNDYDRGYFQSNVNVYMKPDNNNLRVLSSEPKNVNNQTQYTTGSSFTVGVDISKNPSFSPSYSISQSKTATISDFSIINNSSGIIGEWNFNLNMLENSIWDMFSSSFMRKGKVRSLPELALRNLQAITECVWYSDGNFKNSVEIQLGHRADHYHCWVTGNWASYVNHYHHIWKYTNKNIKVDFNSVNLK